MHRDEAIYARADARGVTLTAEEAAFVADTLWSVAGVQRGTRITRADYAEKARALAARLEAASTTSSP